MSDLQDPGMDARIHPFTVKDALYIHEKRIDELKDSHHEVKRAVASFEDKFKTLMERINEGVSPTMRRIESKQSEIEKQIVQVDSRIEIKFTELNSRVNELDRHFGDKFSVVDALIDRSRDLLWKLALAGIIATASAFAANYLFVQQLKSRINSIPTVIDTHRK